ncbi:hypothetical protein JTB14_027323 [Gonioctena quinquepunctata]|nr:hypothetical protein JTB14_027323 [Gonioctena quinquepunctata]
MNLNNIVVQGKIELITFIFNNRKQGVDEPFYNFLRDFKKNIQSCEYNRQEDSISVDRIILGTSGLKFQEKLLNIQDVTLEKAAEVCRHSEATQKHLEIVRNEDEVTIDAIREDNNYQVT